MHTRKDTESKMMRTSSTVDGGRTCEGAGDYGIKDRTDQKWCKVEIGIENRPMGNAVGAINKGCRSLRGAAECAGLGGRSKCGSG